MEEEVNEDFKRSIVEALLILFLLTVMILAASCSGVKAEQASLRVRSDGPHHAAAMPGVTVNCGKGWRVRTEIGYSGPVYWPGEPRFSSRAPRGGPVGEVFVMKELR